MCCLTGHLFRIFPQNVIRELDCAYSAKMAIKVRCGVFLVEERLWITSQQRLNVHLF